MRGSIETRQQARSLRKSLTEAERLLWQHLRNRGLGSKFRRLHPIGPYIADFCCPECGLIVEVDGLIHHAQAERDASRTVELERRGYHVLRFGNEEVMHDLERVLEAIYRYCQGRK
jgi:very-short-patch-repair endonuclease